MQIDWWTLALQALNFLVLVWLLQRFLFRPVRHLIETRKAKSDEMLRAAEGKLAEAEAEKTRYSDLVAEFEARKESDLKDFQGGLDRDREARLAKAQAEAEAMIAAARDAIAGERREAIAASRADLIGLARDIASSILAGRAANADLAPDLAAAMAKLDALPDAERRRLADGASAGLSVVTATTLDKDKQDDIAGTLRTKFGDGVPVAFRVEPDLLGGVKLVLPEAQLDASWASYLDAAAGRLQESGDEHV